jgi:hypothetical protein
MARLDWISLHVMFNLIQPLLFLDSNEVYFNFHSQKTVQWPTPLLTIFGWDCGNYMGGP